MRKYARGLKECMTRDKGLNSVSSNKLLNHPVTKVFFFKEGNIDTHTYIHTLKSLEMRFPSES